MSNENQDVSGNFWNLACVLVVIVITLIALFFLVPVIGYPVEET